MNRSADNIVQPELRTAFSTVRDEQQAVDQLYQQLNGPGLNFVVFFCSAEYQLDILASALKHRFSGVLIAGCTTAGEMTAMGYDQGSISAIGFFHEAFAVSAQLVEQLDHFSFSDAQNLVQQLSEQCLQQNVAPIKDHSFALTLFDGLSTQEERVLVTLDSALGSIPHFGGSAGDDIYLRNTHVYFDGAFYSEAAVIILLNTLCEFNVFSGHHMKSRANKMVVTEADSRQRRVLELNAEPAALEYARVVGLPLEQLDHEVFALNPIAVRIGNEYFVRSIQRVNDDQSLTFYCAVEKGIVLTLMQPGELMATLDEQLTAKERALGEHLVTLGCDCFLRRLEAQIRGQSESVSALLRRHRVVGFNTYGEQIDGMHVNQTFTGVAIGRRL